MTDVIEHSATRSAGYALVAALAAVVWWRGRGSEGAWSSFWLLTIGLLGSMAVARLAGIGDIVTDVGRERVRAAGWYESRRAIQATVVVTGAAIGAVGAAIVIIRAPRRWSRFVPVAMAVAALVAFALVRLVSLRRVDDVIHGREVGAVRVGTIVEYTLVAIAGLAVALHLRDDTGDASAEARR